VRFSGESYGLRATDPEVQQEWAIAGTLAAIKVLLATANFGVILSDANVPLSSDSASLASALFAALLFWIYSATAYVGVRRRWFSIKVYGWLTPMLDIGLCSLLILATDGHASPFNTWLALAVVGTGFSPDRRIPLLATITAIAAHAGIAMVPQAETLSPAVLLVRTTYLFGFAAMVAALGGTLAQQARFLGAVERTGAALGAAKTEGEATDLLFSSLQRLLSDPEVALSRDDGPALRRTGRNGGAKAYHIPLRNGSGEFGEVVIRRQTILIEAERRWIMLLCERYTTAIRRVRLSSDLLSASSRAERLRMADELHDGYLQTLTAVGFYLEALRSNQGQGSDEDLAELADMVRQAVIQARKLIEPHNGTIVGGEEHLRSIFEERWGRDYSIVIDHSVELTEGRWRVMEMMVKEGLNNARRHGRATHARLRLQQSGHQTVALLEANGDGPEGEVPFGYGLSRLKVLANGNGGEVSLARTASGGSCLRVTFEAAVAVA
jgi:signal transduction histidine kinase